VQAPASPGTVLPEERVLGQEVRYDVTRRGTAGDKDPVCATLSSACRLGPRMIDATPKIRNLAEGYPRNFRRGTYFLSARSRFLLVLQGRICATLSLQGHQKTSMILENFTMLTAACAAGEGVGVLVSQSRLFGRFRALVDRED